MNGTTRAIATLAGAAGAGALLWLAGRLGRDDNGGYWAAYGIVAAAGFVFALLQLRGRNGNPRALFVLGFLPVLVVGGWILLALEPHPDWFRDHVLAWSGDLHVRSAVDAVGTWLGVVAFAIGYTLRLVVEPAPRRRDEAVTRPAPAFERGAADRARHGGAA